MEQAGAPVPVLKVRSDSDALTGALTWREWWTNQLALVQRFGAVVVCDDTSGSAVGLW